MIARPLTLAAVLILATPASAQTYRARDLGKVYAEALNASGQVVGNYITGGSTHAFLTGANGAGRIDLGTGDAHAINANGQVVGESGSGVAFITGANGAGMTSLGGLIPGHSVAYGINTAGQVTGYYNFADGTSQAFLTVANNTRYLDLARPPFYTAPGSEGLAVNASGQVVGDFPGFGGTAFITGANGAGMTNLGSLAGGSSTFASAINDRGQVVGYTDFRANNSDSGVRSFITGANGVGMTELGTLGGAFTMADGINVRGQVVGHYSDVAAGNLNHAFLTGADGAGMTDLNSLVTLPNGAFLEQADGINDAGQIVALASNGHSYLLSPVPEPETYALLLAGMGVFAIRFRRRRAATSAG